GVAGEGDGVRGGRADLGGRVAEAREELVPEGHVEWRGRPALELVLRAGLRKDAELASKTEDAVSGETIDGKGGRLPVLVVEHPGAEGVRNRDGAAELTDRYAGEVLFRAGRLLGAP